MKIVNETTGELVISFDWDDNSGCGFIPAGGKPLERTFGVVPERVRITVQGKAPIVYEEGLSNDVTITVLSKIEGGE